MHILHLPHWQRTRLSMPPASRRRHQCPEYINSRDVPEYELFVLFMTIFKEGSRIRDRGIFSFSNEQSLAARPFRKVRS